jgi:signal transduction histidine kinase
LLVREAVSDLQGQAMAKEISLELDVEGETAVWVQGDETLIRQAVSNLIDNGIKHSPHQSKIQMTIAIKDNNLLEFKIQDNGKGIPAGDLPYIFDEFYQVKSDNNKEGIGLGLTLVRSIAEAHGGQVWVQSDPDIGTVFGLQMPIVEESNPDSEPNGIIHNDLTTKGPKNGRTDDGVVGSVHPAEIENSVPSVKATADNID